MKKILVLFIIISWFEMFSQEKGIVYYGHIESPGKGSAIGLDFNSYLAFDKNESYYVTAKDSLETDSNIENQKKTKTDGETKQIYIGKHTLEQGKQVYFDRKSDSLWWNKKYKESIYGIEKRTPIKWSLENETKKIGDFNCKKAVGDFRGRQYTAWYTVEIPVPYGPWKLLGLPGLILEVYDTNKELYIYFKNIEYPNTKNNLPLRFNKLPEDKNQKWLTIDQYGIVLKEIVEKNKTKAILLSKEYGITVIAGEMKDISIELFE